MMYQVSLILVAASSFEEMTLLQQATPEDIDEWERLGATGWNANSMVP